MNLNKQVTRYDNKDDFYADRGGARSEEKDFGARWEQNILGLALTSQETNAHFWRVSAVEKTGDVYAFDMESQVTLLLGSGRSPAINDWEGQGYGKVDEMLDGWAERHGRGADYRAKGGLQWVTEQLEPATPSRDKGTKQDLSL